MSVLLHLVAACVDCVLLVLCVVLVLYSNLPTGCILRLLLCEMYLLDHCSSWCSYIYISSMHYYNINELIRPAQGSLYSLAAET